MSKYKAEFVHWDVSNEMLHFNFYEERQGPNESLALFRAAQQADPRATLFMTSLTSWKRVGPDSTVDKDVERLVELRQGGAVL